MEYVLVMWPDVQALMKHAWFDEECILLNPLEDQEQYNSAYMVPKHRLDGITDDRQFMEQIPNGIPDVNSNRDS